MAPLNVDHETLGVKHKKYNQLVNDALANETKFGTEFKKDKHDLDNLIKIDIAGHNNDVNYILSVLKSDDMLYVSRAIKACPWLVNDEYAHIMNPTYLQENLFPQMTTKATIKLMKLLKKNLKNESRVEEFYKNESDIKAATKWFVNCPLLFIEANIEKHINNIEFLDLKRLCEKSNVIFSKLVKHVIGGPADDKKTLFMLNKDTEKYLDEVEQMPRYMYIRFNAKATNIIMKIARERVMGKLKTYLPILDIPTFAKYLKTEEIKDFLYKQANEDDFFINYRSVLFRYEIMKHFIKRLPKFQQFAFVKNLFIDKTIKEIDENTLKQGTEMFANKRICTTVCNETPSYVWYTFAPFDVAFNEIKKLIYAETSYDEKYNMLRVLIETTQGNMTNLKTLLVYYNNQHVKDDLNYKNNFVGDLVSLTTIHKYDDDTWQELNKILTNMNVFKESEDDYQLSIQSVLLYDIVNDKLVPESITKKFTYNNLTQFKYKLDKEGRQKIFTFLYNYVVAKIEKHVIKDEDTFREAVDWVEKLMELLRDWDKELPNYPFVIEKVRTLINIRKDNSWKVDLRCLYNKNKSWRKYMFEESLALYPTQDACINALKHDPDLLRRNQKDVDNLRSDEKLFLKQVHKKLRIYWSSSIADEWTYTYLKRLGHSGGQTATVRGLCMLLTPDPLSKLIIKHAPETPKIDWNRTDEVSLGLQRAFAKNMHIARPQPSPDSVLLYAKGDYLQYAIPSLLAIFYNLSHNNSQDNIPKMLNAPVSLQKHGLRFAFLKLEQNELKQYLSNIWNESKNLSIRAVIFELTYHLLCKEKDENKVTSLWELLNVFMDNLTFKEDKKIYQLLHQIETVPLKVRAKFLMKSYTFLKELFKETKNNEYVYKVEMLANYTREVMKDMDSLFMEQLIKEFVDEKFVKYAGKYLSDVSAHSGIVPVITSYVLTGENKQTQKELYEKVIVPLMKLSLDKWNETSDGDYFIRLHFLQILLRFVTDLKEYVHKNKLIVPTEIFKSILDTLQPLPIAENYLMLTMFKLAVRITELIEKHNNENWDTVCMNITPELSNICMEYLKEDVQEYFPSIYILYSRAVDMALGNIFPDKVKLYVCELLLTDIKFHYAYLTALQIYPNYVATEEKEKAKKFKDMIRQHPSVEVKMHYYSKFKDEEEDEQVEMYGKC